MRVGVRGSPHLDALLQGIRACGDEIVQHYQPCDVRIAWGWPQAEAICKEAGCGPERVIAVDAHPFALAAGEKSGARILQLGNWGALAKYPSQTAQDAPGDEIKSSHPSGPVLVLGHVASTEQIRGGLVDAWFTPGGDAWLRDELQKPGRRFRPHPRMWDRPGERQPSLADDLKGCSRAVAWNSTASVHARQLGYPATTIEPHGWGAMTLARLAGLRALPAELRSGAYWHEYRAWLGTLSWHPELAP